MIILMLTDPSLNLPPDVKDGSEVSKVSLLLGPGEGQEGSLF